MGRASKGNDRIPTIHVQVRTVSFRKGNMSRLINTDGLLLTKMTAVREFFHVFFAFVATWKEQGIREIHIQSVEQ